jgi:hypothetical protein
MGQGFNLPSRDGRKLSCERLNDFELSAITNDWRALCSSVLESTPLGNRTLTQLQFDAMVRSPYLHMTETEASSFEQRRLRISEIADLLAKMRNAARTP